MEDVKAIVKRDISLPNPCDENKNAFVLDNVFTEEECNQWIQEAEKRGFTVAEVNVGGGRQKLMTDYRNSQRCIWDSTERANDIWHRIEPFMPKTFKKRNCLGLNERLRLLRYDPGHFFMPHMDGTYQRDNGERSYITIQLYLNEGYKGGSTTFLHSKNASSDRMSGPETGDVEYVPKTGSVLVFDHPILHEGSVLFEGRKYCLRTDVMFSAIDYSLCDLAIK